MSYTTNGKDFAYPFDVDACLADSKPHLGLTKREYFAAAALKGLLASDTRDVLTKETAAAIAVRCADALIEALNK